MIIIIINTYITLYIYIYIYMPNNEILLNMGNFSEKVFENWNTLKKPYIMCPSVSIATKPLW